METIEFESEKISLKDLLKASGLVATGGLAKHIIKTEGLSLNGEECFIPGKKVFPGDEVVYDNYLIKIV